jgi:hypothetical protein
MPSSTPVPRPVRVFVAYAHEDIAYRDRLVKIMVPWVRQGLVEVWADHKLAGGDVWDEKIKEALEEADLILILMSVDAIASEYIHGVELRRAMERHEQGTARVIPLIVRICAWKEETWLGQVQAVPRGGTPIAEHASPDRAWDEVREQLKGVIDELRISMARPVQAAGQRATPRVDQLSPKLASPPESAGRRKAAHTIAWVGLALGLGVWALAGSILAVHYLPGSDGFDFDLVAWLMVAGLVPLVLGLVVRARASTMASDEDVDTRRL